MVSTTISAEIVIKDDKENIVRLNSPAKRIISLAPHITETLFKAGAGEKIVGAVEYSDFPEAAKKITRIGGHPAYDIEKIISLNPDLIIAWASGNNLNQVELFTKLGIPVYLSEPVEIDDIAQSIQNFGILAGTQVTATSEKNNFLSHYKEIRDKKHKKVLKVFYQIWNKPLMTINGHHIISKVIGLCGGVNIFSNLKSLTPVVSKEAVLASKTQVIIAGGGNEERVGWLNEWKSWLQLPAVKKDNIYFVNPDLIQRAGPRILQGADQLCELLERARK